MKAKGTTETATDKVFAGSIPEIYDRFMVPLIFEPYAIDLAGRIAGAKPGDVLETAAGTGVLTRALVARLAADVRLTATDLNKPMLDQAAARQSDPRRVTWRQADALALPFPDRSFDVVACQFGAMFFPDKIQGYREALRVLRPGGRFWFAVWDDIATSDFADVVTQVLAEMFPQDPPRFMARTPHGYHDAGLIREQLTAAGFPNVSIETVDHRSKAPSPRDVAIGYCQGTPLRGEIETRDKSRLDEATDKATEAIAAKFGHGPVDGRIRALIINAAR
jgi:ubiquinone/menaquinone biosynthesis C-methylase UbiE